MKNKTIKVLISFFLTFIFMSFVNAGFSDEKCLNLKMTSVSSPSHFDTKVPTCDWVGPTGYVEVKGNNGSHFPTMEEALAVGEEEIYVTVYSGSTYDEKGLSTGGGDASTIKVKRCDSPLAKVRIYYTCKKTVSKEFKPDSMNCKCPESNKYNCECGDSRWECPSGTTETGPYICEKVYNGKQEVEKGGKFDASKAAIDANGGFTASNCTEGDKALLCPQYDCKPTEKTISACAPEYQIEGTNKNMYCVSPGLHFTQKSSENGYGRSITQGYEVDKDFDYRKCSSSYVSEGCGYANILIESDWLRKYGTLTNYKDLLDYQTVNLAMRLYGAHVTTRGYENVSGLGIYYGEAGQDSCNDMNVFFVRPTVYSITEQVYITNKYLDYITEKYTNTYLEAGTFMNDSFFDLSCNKLGLICHVNNSDRNKHIRAALGLFFNTILGNSKMFTHIEDLYGIKINEPQSTDLISTEELNTSRVVTEYGDIHYEKLEIGKEYNCDELDSMDEETANRIKPYCFMKTKYIDSNGNEFDVRPEYCTGKHALRCISKKIPVAVCDSNRVWQKVIYKYPSSTEIGPERLISCDSPSSNQFMYGIIDDENLKIDGDDIISSGSEKEKTIFIDSLECKKQITCNDISLREQNVSCNPPSSEDEFKSKINGDVVTGFVKDPSLKCILNASENNKRKYDYSEVFGVNTNLCRVYCSDEVKYYIPDRVQVKNGASFSYDIAARSYLNINTDYKISNVVKEKRSCVSEIYYKNEFPTNIAWDQIYGLTLDFIKKNNNGKNITNWQELYNVVSKASNQKVVINGKEFSNTSKDIKENLNELIYDLYNCNFFNQNVFNTNKITKPRQRTFGSNKLNENVFDDYIVKEFDSSNAYGLHGGNNNNTSNCKLDGNSLTCMNMDTISYSAGSEMVSGGRIGELRENNKIKISNVSNSNRTNVTYCRDNETNGKCFEYSSTILKGSKEDLDSYDYQSMDNKTKTILFNGRNVLIPENDYAMFTVTTEIGFYNDDVFQTEPSTGKVKKIDNEDKTKLVLDRYNYPVSKDAYSLCDSTYANGKNIYYDPIVNLGTYKSKEYNNCKVVHYYNNLNTYYRIQFNDDFKNKITNIKPSCYYEVTGNQAQCTPGIKTCLNGIHDMGEYRNVDRSNLFPNANLSEKETNWDTEEGRIAKSEIENANTDIFIDDKYVEYSFSLSPQQIKNIRVYNRTATQYVEVEVDNCELSEKGFYLNCRSVIGGLLDEIRKESQDGSVTGYATILNNKDGSDLFYRKKD